MAGHRRPTDFERAVVAVVASIPPGEVVTYGEVAAEAGHPGAHRAVGAVLARSPDLEVELGCELPWWRVVTASGRLVPGHEAEHARRLVAEGVRVRGTRVVGADAVPAPRSRPPVS